MAAATQWRSGGRVWWCLSVARRCFSSSAGPTRTPPSLPGRALFFLCQRFYDVEQLVSWSSALKAWRLRKKNSYYGYTQKLYGDNVAAAFYILSIGGAVRFAGQSEWFRSDRRGRFSWDFLSLRDVPLEEVDASGTLINHTGLDNLVTQSRLRSLCLRGCPAVDGWFVSRLHVFSDSLEELCLSNCPRLSEGGLLPLTQLRGLRKLDLSALPGVSNSGLLRILLEEQLPACTITGIEYAQGLTLTDTHSHTLPETHTERLTL
ncbi:distal membrane-arm assembly complex protein 2 isoform X2 [Amia ocellicauda]|uniref:distal membrane-arm assembly complex protein 2 isoform X2 n=1 Tax=Amia ocellicauda TaxID=2972642 RepID=UPI003463B35D